MARTAAERPPSLSLSVQAGRGVRELPASRDQLRRWVRAALSRDASLALRFVGTQEGRELNRAYRGKDYATNVLTFAYDSEAGGPVQADVVICMPVLRAEARAAGIALREHLAHLVVHGALHAQGWDHEDDDEAREMEAREVEILRRFRIADPYAR